MHHENHANKSFGINASKQELLIEAGRRRRMQEFETAMPQSKWRTLVVPERYAMDATEYSALND